MARISLHKLLDLLFCFPNVRFNIYTKVKTCCERNKPIRNLTVLIFSNSGPHLPKKKLCFFCVKDTILCLNFPG